MHVEAQAFPILFATVQAEAKRLGERCTSEMFAKQVKRYPRDQLRVVENKLSVMTAEQRAVVLKAMGVG